MFRIFQNSLNELRAKSTRCCILGVHTYSMLTIWRLLPLWPHLLLLFPLTFLQAQWNTASGPFQLLFPLPRTLFQVSTWLVPSFLITVTFPGTLKSHTCSHSSLFITFITCLLSPSTRNVSFLEKEIVLFTFHS